VASISVKALYTYHSQVCPLETVTIVSFKLPTDFLLGPFYAYFEHPYS